MKLAVLLPFVLLLGLVIGGWAPKEEARSAQKEIADLRKKLAESEKGSRADVFTRMVKIPERATKPSSPAKLQVSVKLAPADPASNAVSVAEQASNSTEQARSEQPSEKPLKPEDMRARIDEAKELWKTRVDVARAQWVARLKLTPDQEALFNESINAMNEQLYLSMQKLADTLAASDTLTPEAGTRAFSEMTAALVQTYDSLGAIVPEEQLAEAAKIELTDFIDPAVAEPLIDVQDKLEKLPKDRQPGMRFGR